MLSENETEKEIRHRAEIQNLQDMKSDRHRDSDTDAEE